MEARRSLRAPQPLHGGYRQVPRGRPGIHEKIGSLDDFKPQLDWAYGDYKFASWFGARAGKVKTAMGLYNDTQDMEFLHTWALLAAEYLSS